MDNVTEILDAIAEGDLHTMETTMKTVLITGCSSGYGLETARHFHSQGWNVVATMRTPRERSAPVGTAPRAAARRDEAREHRSRARGKRAHRRARQQRGHRALRRL